MNYINIKQIGNLQDNLNGLSDSIYQTGQFLLGVNDGTQTLEGQKTFTDDVFFNSGVRVYGGLTGSSAEFTDSVRVHEEILISGGVVPSLTSTPEYPTSLGNPGQMAYTNSHFYVCTGVDSWARADISGWA